MQNKPITPERQLLNLIEKGSPKESINAQTAKRRGLSLFSPGAWKGRFSFFSFKARDWFNPGSFRRVDIRVVNSFLGFSSFILVLWLAYTVYSSFSFMKSHSLGLGLNSAQKASSAKEAVRTSILKTASYYLEKARSRNIFKMVERNDAQKPQEPQAKFRSDTLNDKIKDLKLVGISWSEDPDVMIEDTNRQSTYFLKKGQFIENLGLKIEAVFKDKVILSVDGQEVELK